MSRKPRRLGPYSAPKASRRLYLRLAPCGLAKLKFLLEAHDNLGYLSIIDRRGAVVKLTYSPSQEREVEDFLGQAVSFGLNVERLALPLAAAAQQSSAT